MTTKSYLKPHIIMYRLFSTLGILIIFTLPLLLLTTNLTTGSFLVHAKKPTKLFNNSVFVVSNIVQQQNAWQNILLKSKLNNTNKTAGTYDLAISKTIDNNSPLPGQQIEYQISYQNLGNSTASNIIITNILPTDVTYLSHSTPANFSSNVTGKQVVWQLPTLDAGKGGILTIQAQVLNQPTSEFLTNTVTILSDDSDNNQTNNLALLATPIATQSWDLTISKTLTLSPSPGGEIEYRIFYQNLSHFAATNVIITNTLPTSTTFLSSQNYSDFSTTITNNTIIFAKPNLIAHSDGYLTVRLKLSDTLTVGDIITNIVQISSDNNDLNYTNNIYTLATTIISPTWNLDVSKTLAAGLPFPNQTITYTIFYTNSGNMPATNVIITDILPLNTQSISTTPTTGLFTWLITQVHPNQSGQLDLAIHISNSITVGTILTNIVQISMDNPDHYPQNNTYTLPLTIQMPAPNLTIKKTLTGSTDIPPDGEMTYQIYFTNNGTQLAQNIIITDILPYGTEFLSWGGTINNLDGSFEQITPPTIGTANLPNQQQLIWYLDTLQIGAEGLISLTVELEETLNPTTVLTNIVQISADGGLFDTASHPITLSNPSHNMYIAKSLDAIPVPPGQIMDYNILFENKGNLPAEQIIITDILPSNVRFVSWTAYLLTPDYKDLTDTISFTVNLPQLQWQLNTQLPPNVQGFISLKVKVLNTAQIGSILTNTAILAADKDDNLLDNTTIQKTIIPAPTQNIRIENFKIKNMPGTPGGGMVYEIRYFNNGNTAANNITITLTLADQLNYLSDSNLDNLPNGINIANQVIWTRTVLNQQQGGTILVRVGLSNNLNIGDIITSTVQIDSTSADINYNDNNRILAIQIISPTIDLDIYKTILGVVGSPGGEMDYSIFYQNKGNWLAENITITDTLPSEVQYISHQVADTTTTVIIENNTLILNKPNIDFSEYATLTIRVRITDTAKNEDKIINQVQISSNNYESNQENNTYALETILTVPTWDLGVETKLASGLLKENQTILYEIAYYTNSNYPATNVVITNTLPEHTEPVTSSLYTAFGFTTTITGNTIVWTTDVINLNQSGYLNVPAKIKSTVLLGDILINRADISFNKLIKPTLIDRDLSNNTSFATDEILYSFSMNYLPLIIKTNN